MVFEFLYLLLDYVALPWWCLSTLTLLIFALSRITPSKVSFSNLDFLGFLDTFDFYPFKNCTFESDKLGCRPHILRYKSRVYEVQSQYISVYPYWCYLMLILQPRWWYIPKNEIWISTYFTKAHFTAHHHNSSFYKFWPQK